MDKKTKVRNIITCVCSIITFIILGLMAYIGLSAIFSLPMPDIIDNFNVFYGIFASFELYSLTIVLPLILCTCISLAYFFDKNAKLIIFILELVFIVIIFLHGFGAF